LNGTIKLLAETALRLSCSARQEKFGRSVQQSLAGRFTHLFLPCKEPSAISD
jgi:hypothetical protein